MVIFEMASTLVFFQAENDQKCLENPNSGFSREGGGWISKNERSRQFSFFMSRLL